MTQASVTEFEFHPRTISHARAIRSGHVGVLVHGLVVRAFERLTGLLARLAEARRRRRDLATLLEMDNRLLSDIGLTRGEIRAAARTPWWREPAALADAARRREEAMAGVQRQAALRVVRTRPIVPDAAKSARQEPVAA